MKAGAVIQARMGSTRLPGKVLAPIGAHPLLGHVLRRLQRARRLAFVGVATTTARDDDAIVDYCHELGVPCFRGSEHDLVDRFAAAADAWALDPVVRITGDCPFLCPEALDALLAPFASDDPDYTRFDEPTVHEGIDPFSRSWLRRVARLALGAEEREHPVRILFHRPETARVLHVASNPRDRARPGLRLSVDEPADLAFARRVYAELAPHDAWFDTAALLALVDAQPELVEINRHVARRVPRGAS